MKEHVQDAVDARLREALAASLSSLRSFAEHPDLADLLKQAFGPTVDLDLAAAELRSMASGVLPRISIVSSATLHSALAAYSSETNDIFVSESLASGSSSSLISSVLLEELGHRIDAIANAGDAPGDEGELFARLVQGRLPTQPEFAAIKAQDDHGAIQIGSQALDVEFAQYGPVNVDGSLVDWTEASRLDTSGGVAGYQMWGQYTDGAFVFALSAPVAIGNNTTFWFNTDRVLSTGYQVWGFAAGAEYNINFDSAGVPHLYTGADGQTLVPDATVDFAFSADRTTVEFAISGAALGGTQALDVYVDVNNSVFLPSSYANFTYTVTAPTPAPPPVPVGTLTLDGSLADWTAADRIDSTLGIAGYEIYGKVTGDNYVIAMKAPTAIGANSTVWLNADQNAATGYQIWGFAGGAEYNVTINGQGNAILYSGGAGQSAVANGDVLERYSTDRTIVEIAIPKELLGFSGAPSAINTMYDINDVAFLPTQYALAQYTINAPTAPVAGTVTLDGSLTDWTAAQRIDGVAPISGWEVYGRNSGDSYVFAIKAPTGVTVGANTTAWLNTDQNSLTGFQIFGPGSGGAEYNINFDANGVPFLYTGGAGEVASGTNPLLFGRSADGSVVEFAVTKAAIGNPTAIDTVFDANNDVFLPGSFSGPQYSIFDTSGLPPRTDFSKKIAIVYSDTTAALYFGNADVNINKTGYSQLFMAAQNQAAMAGVPFDLLTETDLKDLAKLVNYDAIVFPSYQFATAADVPIIQNNLTLLAQNYNTSFIAAGNFMTGDENGNALAGDAYARMKVLFDLSPNASGFEGTTSVLIESAGTGFGGVGGYTAGEDIRTYSNVVGGVPQLGVGWLAFSDATPGDTPVTAIANQTVSGAGAGTYTAVQTTSSNGDRNVHFSTEALLGDNNQLWQAISYAVNGSTGPAVGLQLGRQSAIVASRNDMDQSQYIEDVDPVTGAGIYDALIPILQDWKTAYNFVGSYYINVGAYSDSGEQTNWTVSKPYFDSLLAMGNEIGSHSYTHPANTNLLLPDTIDQETLNARIEAYTAAGAQGICYCPYCMREDADQAVLDALAGKSVAEINQILATALAATDFSNPNRVDPSTLDPVSKAILEASYKFQFATSRHVIEAELGSPISGAAIPGAPELLPTSIEVLQYYDYLSGGYSAVGAGYPGAFGYLTPAYDDLGKVYLAPNMSFDFTFIEFQGKTPAEAQALWQAEFASLTDNAELPVILWPWHDYGVTNWPTGSGRTYTESMFTSLVSTAFDAGAEFVTLADLAQRVESFESASLTTSVAGSVITATVASADAGRFALDLDNLGTQVISSVANWYAYDGDSVFTDRDGGSYVITLGSAATDVTHITAFPMRAELISVSGDGANLAFSVSGEGLVTIDLASAGVGAPVVTGASIVSQVGDILTLDLGPNGLHNVTVSLSSSNQAPVITSNGGGDATSISYAENGTAAVATVVATDADAGQSVTYAISGGVDAALFSINPTTGIVSFLASPDFETPLDAGANNIYDVLVRATDNGAPSAFDEQALAITVTNVVGITYNGNSAANTANGTVEPDVMNGAGGNDILNGLAGNDTINGGAGNDSLAGDVGNDSLNGAGGSDTVIGGAGDDILLGGAGNDNLNGGDGNDLITGGTGLDFMTGGAGADTFFFLTAAESRTSGVADSILDFVNGSDRIDLSVFDANTTIAGIQDFVFIGSSALTAAGQLHFRYDAATDQTIVEGNTNANATNVEFQVVLSGNLSLNASDFVL